MSSVTRTRAEHESRLLEERRRAERGKHLVVLMLQHLTNAGYTGTVEALTAESGVSLAQYEVADNIESQNLSTDGSVQDSHMVSSHILAKIPVDDVVCALQYESSPYFLNSSNRHISELRFHLIDHHAPRPRNPARRPQHRTGRQSL